MVHSMNKNIIKHNKTKLGIISCTVLEIDYCHVAAFEHSYHPHWPTKTPLGFRAQTEVLKAVAGFVIS